MASVSNRYARAFADVVLDLKLDPGQIVEQVRSLVAVVAGSPDLRRVWDSPAIPGEQKRKLLDRIVSTMGVEKRVRNFIAVLIDHHRIAALGEIARQFEHDLNSRLGFAEAEITSARALSESEKRSLEAQIASLTGKKVRAQYAQDSSVLGGAVVKIGSTIYDGSVRGQLQRLKEQLSAG
jgi:F-type H+-transporting ATPase subunit delta